MNKRRFQPCLEALECRSMLGDTLGLFLTLGLDLFPQESRLEIGPESPAEAKQAPRPEQPQVFSSPEQLRVVNYSPFVEKYELDPLVIVFGSVGDGAARGPTSSGGCTDEQPILIDVNWGAEDMPLDYHAEWNIPFYLDDKLPIIISGCTPFSDAYIGPPEVEPPYDGEVYGERQEPGHLYLEFWSPAIHAARFDYWIDDNKKGDGSPNGEPQLVHFYVYINVGLTGVANAGQPQPDRGRFRQADPWLTRPYVILVENTGDDYNKAAWQVLKHLTPIYKVNDVADASTKIDAVWRAQGRQPLTVNFIGHGTSDVQHVGAGGSSPAPVGKALGYSERHRAVFETFIETNRGKIRNIGFYGCNCAFGIDNADHWMNRLSAGLVSEATPNVITAGYTGCVYAMTDSDEGPTPHLRSFIGIKEGRLRASRNGTPDP